MTLGAHLVRVMVVAPALVIGHDTSRNGASRLLITLPTPSRFDPRPEITLRQRAAYLFVRQRLLRTHKQTCDEAQSRSLPEVCLPLTSSTRDSLWLRPVPGRSLPHAFRAKSCRRRVSLYHYLVIHEKK